jgi:hypothetical protein
MIMSQRTKKLALESFYVISLFKRVIEAKKERLITTDEEA